MEPLRSDGLSLVAKAVTAVGSDQFASTIADLCQGLFGLDSLFISVFSPNKPPRQLFSNLDAEATERTIVPYLSHAYLLDPFFDLFNLGVGTCVVSLDECAPDDFRASEYYRLFYSEIGLGNEVTIFIATGSGASIVLSLGQRRLLDRVPIAARPALEQYLPVVSALCLKHWPDAGNCDTNSAVAPTIDRFQAGRLSNRETEIVQLMLKGHSTKSMARLLGNSPETVKVHRKRIYAKLKISSQGELFSMFFAAPVPAGADPEPPMPPMAPPLSEGQRRRLN